MEVNFGGTRHLIEAVKKLGQDDTTRFVYIGTVAKTGDRMPPIHWDRVGDPPSSPTCSIITRCPKLRRSGT